MQLDNEIAREKDQSALLDERAAAAPAILGHDLRNPLPAISATSEFMLRKSVDTMMRGMAARIKADSKRMSSLIGDVLDFTRGRSLSISRTKRI